MLWGLGAAVGLVLLTVVIFALARPVTARWERERTPGGRSDD